MNLLRAGSLTLEPQLTIHAAEMFAGLSDPAIRGFENAPPWYDIRDGLFGLLYHPGERFDEAAGLQAEVLRAALDA